MAQPNQGWRVLTRPKSALLLVLLYLSLMVVAQMALSKRQGTHSEKPVCAENRVWIRDRLLRFACGPRGPPDNRQEIRLACPPLVDKPPSWDLSCPMCL